MLKLLAFVLAAAAIGALRDNGSASSRQEPKNRNGSKKSDLSTKTKEQIRIELDQLYQRKNSLHDRLKKLQEELSLTYSSLEEATADLDRWYRKANGNWLGNGGEELPKYALFGQSTSDRDYLKREKDRFRGLIGRLKSEKSNILKSELPSLKRTIKRLKSEKRRR
jgi:hypothetical protein